MNHESLIALMDGVSDDLIAEAAAPQRKTLTLRRYVAFAAAVAAVLALVLGIPFLNRDNEIITAPGVITVKAYSPDSSSPAFIEKYEGIELEKDTVDFDTHRPSPYFSMLYNYHPGILLSVSVPEEYGENITYQVIMPGTQLDEVFKYEEYYYDKQDTWIFNNGDTISCRFSNLLDTAYIQFILYDGDHIVGYMVVKAYHVSVEGATPRAYYAAELLDAVYFPAVSGKRQYVSMNYVNQQIAALIGQE